MFRLRYLGVSAIVLVAVVVVAVRCARDTNKSLPRVGVQAEPAVASSPNHTRAASIPAVATRTSAGSALGADIPKLSSRVVSTSLPTELPSSLSLEQRLSRNGAVPDWREHYNYQLGLMAYYEKCMGSRIEKGVIYYYIRWLIDEDHLASSPVFEFANEPMQGEISDEAKLRFAACVKEYLALNDHVYLPHDEAGGKAWGMGAIFPLSDSPLLKMIAETTSKNDPDDLGSDSSSSGAAAHRQ